MERQRSHHVSRRHSTAALSDVKRFLKKTKQKTLRVIHRSQETTSVSLPSCQLRTHADLYNSACACCYDDFARRDLVRLACHHSYCKQCFLQLVLGALKSEDKWPPRCCGAAPVDHATCLKNIPRALARRYKEKRQEYSVPRSKRYYCPAPDCGLFVPADRIDAPFRRARCRAKHVTCMDCGQAAHADAVRCPRNADMELVQKMAREEGWRRCHRCLTMIEHREACRHIRCRCGAEFCYVCGAVWWTCGCTEGQLKGIKERARRNRDRRRWGGETQAFWKAHALGGSQ